MKCRISKIPTAKNGLQVGGNQTADNVRRGQIPVSNATPYPHGSPQQGPLPTFSMQQYNPQSIPSKAWDVITHPATAAGYIAQNQRIPDNFTKGELNNFDAANDVVNPLSWFNYGVEGAGDIRDGNYLSGAAKMAAMFPLANMVPIPKGSVAKVINKGVQAFKSTPDLKMTKRIDNAINAASLGVDYPGDRKIHSYFAMSPEEVMQTNMSEINNLPRGAVSMDVNMSANSSPLFWNEAARQAKKDFTIIRTGANQPLNSAGTKGRRVERAIPEEVLQAYPDIVAGFEDRVKRLTDIGDLKMAKAIKKDGVGQEVMSELYENMRTGSPREAEFARRSYEKFLNNYLPELDKPIDAVNRVTGLNFPKSKVSPKYGDNLVHEQPTIAAVKGNPKSRFSEMLPSKKQYKKQLKELYFGKEPKKPNPFDFDMELTPQQHRTYRELLRGRGSDLDLPIQRIPLTSEMSEYLDIGVQPTLNNIVGRRLSPLPRPRQSSYSETFEQGGYIEGKELNLSPAEVKRLLAEGYDVEIL